MDPGAVSVEQSPPDGGGVLGCAAR